MAQVSHSPPASHHLGTLAPVTDLAAPPLDPDLTPVQRRTLEALRRGEHPVVFDETFVSELQADAATGLAELAERLGSDKRLYVSKHGVASVLGCEAHHVAPDDFTWTPARARGQVAHRAIQLLLNWRGDPAPADLVDEALSRLADEDTGLGAFVAGLTPGDDADLRGMATERVTKFLECFPPLDRRSNPMTEASLRYPVNGPIQLAAKVDLVIGRPAGRESRKVIVDLKSGRAALHHREDLRFYALVETLRTDVPPRQVATFYLDAGRAEPEDVTPHVLRTALRRTLDAVERMIELQVEGRPPRRSPNASCRWCPVSADCEPGQAFLAGPGGDDRHAAGFDATNV